MQEVVEHLSQLKASLEDTLAEEERLKQQAHRVQRLAQVGITDRTTKRCMVEHFFCAFLDAMVFWWQRFHGVRYR